MSRLTRLGFIDVHRTTHPVRRRVRSRGIPPAIADNEIFYAETVPEASRLLGKALSPGTLQLGGTDSEHFAVSMHGVRLRDISMLHIDLGIAATLDTPAMGPYFAVHMPTNGRARCTHVNGEFEANPIRAAVTSPGMAMKMDFGYDSPQLVIRIEEDALTRHLTRLIGASVTHPIMFEPELDLTTDVAMRWNGAIQLLHTEVFYPDSLIQHGQGIGSLEELLMSTLLLMQPSNYQSRLLLPAENTGRRVVRDTLDYIEAHLGERITMTDIAKNVHMSIRAIQQGFRDELSTTPMLYLRDRRLERAHQDLTDAIPTDGVTVTNIAERWGFTHLSSFATLYRKRWGQPPSDTLRQ